MEVEEDYISAALIRQVLDVCTSLREGNDEEFRIFKEHFRTLNKECQFIQSFVFKAWQGNSSFGSSSSYSSASSSSSSGSTHTYNDHHTNIPSTNSPSANELLSLTLSLPLISWGGVLECMRCINRGRITGRTAIYCISEIRVFLAGLVLSIDSSSSISGNTGTSTAIDTQMGNMVELIKLLTDMAGICIIPFLDNAYENDNEGITGAGAGRGQIGASISASACLDILPDILGSLLSLNKQRRFSSASASATVASKGNRPTQAKSSSSSSSSSTSAVMTSPMAAHESILNTLLGSSVHWPPFSAGNTQHADAFIRMLNCSVELFSHLSRVHVDQLEQRILQACKETFHRNDANTNGSGSGNGNGNASNDELTKTVALVRLCLLLIDVSRDSRWVHLLRTIYRSIPVAQQHSVESLMEQLLGQSLQISRIIISVIEDTAVHQCKTNCRGGSEENEKEKKEKEKEEEVKRTGAAMSTAQDNIFKNSNSDEIGIGKRNGNTNRNPSNHSTLYTSQCDTCFSHRIPVISIQDLRLVILLSRAHRIDGHGHGGGGFKHCYSSSSSSGMHSTVVDTSLILPAVLGDHDTDSYSASAIVSSHRNGAIFGGQPTRPSDETLLSLRFSRAFFFLLLCCMRHSEKASRYRYRDGTGEGNEMKESSGWLPAMNDVLLQTLQLTASPMSASAPFQPSTSTTTSTSLSWLQSFRTIETLNMLLYAVCYPSIMLPCLDVYLRSAEKHSWDDGLKLNSGLDESSWEQGITLTSFFAEALITLFVHHAPNRAGLLHVIMKGLGTCSFTGATAMIDKASRSSKVGSGRGWDRRSKLAQNNRFSPAGEHSARQANFVARQAMISVLLTTFEGICARHSVLLYSGNDYIHIGQSRTSSNTCTAVLTTFLPLLLHANTAPLHVLERVLLPLATIAPQNESLYDTILAMCRKALLSRDSSIVQQLAIRALVAAIAGSTAQQSGHSESVQALVYALSLPLWSHRVVYNELISRIDSSIDTGIHTGTGNGSTFRELQSHVLEKAGMFFSTLPYSSLCFSPKKCLLFNSSVLTTTATATGTTADTATATGTSMSTPSPLIVDDISLLFALCYSLDSNVWGSECMMADMIIVAKHVITMVGCGSQSKFKSRVAEHGKTGIFVGADENENGEFFREEEEKEEEKEEKEKDEDEEEGCSTATGQYLLAIVNFLEIGCPYDPLVYDQDNPVSTSSSSEYVCVSASDPPRLCVHVYYACVHAAVEGLMYCLQQSLSKLVLQSQTLNQVSLSSTNQTTLNKQRKTKQQQIIYLRKALTIILSLLDIFLESVANSTVLNPVKADIGTNTKDLPTDGHAALHEILRGHYSSSGQSGGERLSSFQNDKDKCEIGIIPCRQLALVSIQTVDALLTEKHVRGMSIQSDNNGDGDSDGDGDIPLSALLGAVGAASHEVYKSCVTVTATAANIDIAAPNASTRSRVLAVTELCALLDTLNSIHGKICAVEKEEQFIGRVLQKEKEKTEKNKVATKLGASLSKNSSSNSSNTSAIEATPISSGWSRLLARFTPCLRSGLERWDMPSVCGRLTIDMRNRDHMIRSAILSSFFAMRAELLCALIACVGAINHYCPPHDAITTISTSSNFSGISKGSGTILGTDKCTGTCLDTARRSAPVPVPASSTVMSNVKRTRLSLNYSSDLLRAVRAGATKSVVIASLNVIRVLMDGMQLPSEILMLRGWHQVRGLDDQSRTQSQSQAQRSRAELATIIGKSGICSEEVRLASYLCLLSRDLWNVLSFLDCSHTSLLTPLLRVAVCVSGNRLGFLQLSTLLTAISRGTAQGQKLDGGSVSSNSAAAEQEGVTVMNSRNSSRAFKSYRSSAHKSKNKNKSRSKSKSNGSKSIRYMSGEDDNSSDDKDDDDEEEDIDSQESASSNSDSGEDIHTEPSTEDTILRLIRERNSQQDDIRVKAASSSSSSGVLGSIPISMPESATAILSVQDNMNVDNQQQEHKDKPKDKDKDQDKNKDIMVGRIGVKAEMTILTELLRILTADLQVYRPYEDMQYIFGNTDVNEQELTGVSSGDGGDGDCDSTGSGEEEYALSVKRASSLGHCVFCLFQSLQEVKLAPLSLPQSASPFSIEKNERVVGHAYKDNDDHEATTPIILLLNSTIIPLTKRATVIGLASKWMQWAAKDASRLLRHLRKEIKKQGEGNQSGHTDEEETDNTTRDGNNAGTGDGDEEDEDEDEDEKEDKDDDDEEEDDDDDDEEEEEAGGEDRIGHQSFGYLHYVLAELGLTGFFTIRRWLQQQASSLLAEGRVPLHKDDMLNNNKNKKRTRAFVSTCTGRSANEDYNTPLLPMKYAIDKRASCTLVITSSSLSSFAKQSQLLLHRMDRFFWALRQVLNELDHPRKINGKLISVAVGTSTVGAGAGAGAGAVQSESYDLPQTLKLPLREVNLVGRNILDQLAQQDHDNNNDDASASNSNSSSNRFGSDNYDDSDSDGDAAVSFRRQQKSSKSSDRGRDRGRSKSSVWDNTRYTRTKHKVSDPCIGFSRLIDDGLRGSSKSNSNISRGRGGEGGSNKKRARSRNRVVDEWLGEEVGGHDAYADLEDFLVE